MTAYAFSKQIIFATLAVVGLFSASCGNEPAPPVDIESGPSFSQNPVTTREAQSGAAIGTKPAGRISGRVVLEGTGSLAGRKLSVTKDVEVCGRTDKFALDLLLGPENGIGNAVVYLESAPDGHSEELSTSERQLDQNECVYDPHVLLVPAGATVNIKNSDGILHNIHTYSLLNPAFNTAQPKFKKVISKTFTTPEIIKVTCDVHDWMTAWIVVHDHPHYAVTNTNGTFQLSGVPPGDHTVRIWHESLGEQTRSITVAPAQTTTTDFGFPRSG